MNYWKLSTLALVAVLAAVIGFGPVRDAGGAEKQPYMRSALVNLRSAKAQLEKAEDKGGHCARAVALTDQAIAEVQAGIDLDR